MYSTFSSFLISVFSDFMQQFHSRIISFLILQVLCVRMKLDLKIRKKKTLKPIGSMYGIFTNIYHKNQPNVGEYTIHGSYGKGNESSSNHQFSLALAVSVREGVEQSSSTFRKKTKHMGVSKNRGTPK